MRTIVPFAVLAAASTARAGDHLPPLVVVTSVNVTSSTTDSPWAIISRLGAGGGWCVDTSKGGVGEALTLAFDPPARVDGVTVSLATYASRPTALDVSADGRVLRTTTRGAAIDVPLDGTPIATLVLAVAAFEKGAAPAACITNLQFQGAPEPGVLYGVSATEAAALESRVIAIRRALRTCTKLGDALAFPFRYSRMTMTRNGLDEREDTFASVAKATAACKRKRFVPIVASMRLGATTIVSAADAGRVTIADEAHWHLQLRAGTWVLAAVTDN